MVGSLTIFALISNLICQNASLRRPIDVSTAGVGTKDLDVTKVHDLAASLNLLQIECNLIHSQSDVEAKKCVERLQNSLNLDGKRPQLPELKVPAAPDVPTFDAVAPPTTLPNVSLEDLDALLTLQEQDVTKSVEVTPLLEAKKRLSDLQALIGDLPKDVVPKTLMNEQVSRIGDVKSEQKKLLASLLATKVAKPEQLADLSLENGMFEAPSLTLPGEKADLPNVEALRSQMGNIEQPNAELPPLALVTLLLQLLNGLKPNLDAGIPRNQLMSQLAAVNPDQLLAGVEKIREIQNNLQVLTASQNLELLNLLSQAQNGSVPSHETLKRDLENKVDASRPKNVA